MIEEDKDDIGNTSGVHEITESMRAEVAKIARGMDATISRAESMAPPGGALWEVVEKIARTPNVERVYVKRNCEPARLYLVAHREAWPGIVKTLLPCNAIAFDLEFVEPSWTVPEGASRFDI